MPKLRPKALCNIALFLCRCDYALANDPYMHVYDLRAHCVRITHPVFTVVDKRSHWYERMDTSHKVLSAFDKWCGWSTSNMSVTVVVHEWSLNVFWGAVVSWEDPARCLLWLMSSSCE